MANVLSDAEGASTTGAMPSHEHHVHPRQLTALVAQRLAEPAPDPVTNNRVADLAAHSPAEAGRRVSPDAHMAHHEVAEDHPTLTTVDRVVIRLAHQAHGARPTEPETEGPPGRPPT